MKHLKIFEKFNKQDSYEDILSNCNAILLELNDEGYETKIRGSNNIFLTIKKLKNDDEQASALNLEKFKFSEISNVLNRLTSYLETEGFTKNNFLFKNDKDVYSSFNRKRNGEDLYKNGSYKLYKANYYREK